MTMGLGFTFNIVLFVHKLQKRIGVKMQKAKIFCVKLAVIAIIILNLIIYALATFSSDPGWTHAEYIDDYRVWRTCRYIEYLKSEFENRSADYSDCEQHERLKFWMTLTQAIVTATVGVICNFVLILPSELIIKILRKQAEKDHKSSDMKSKHNKENSKKSGSQSVSHSKGNSVSVESTTPMLIANLSTPSPSTPFFKQLFTMGKKSLTQSFKSDTNDSSHSPQPRGYFNTNKSSSFKSKQKLRQQSGPLALWAESVNIPTSFEYIIIGGGIAAGYAAKEFVEQKIKSDRVAIFSMESIAPYERSHLAYNYLTNPTECSKNMLIRTNNTTQTVEWYAINGVNLFLQNKIVHFDHLTLSIKDKYGSVYRADKAIIIATGSSPRKLPITNIIQAQEFENTFTSTEQSKKPYRNVFYLRSIEDAEKLVNKLDFKDNLLLKEIQIDSGRKEKKNSPICLVIGSSFIGLEVASAAVLKGWRVIIVTKSNSLFSTIFCSEISNIFENYLTSKGVEIIKGNGCNTLLSDCGCVVGCRLNDKTIIKSDIVVVGIGSIPNTELFKNKLQFQSTNLNAPILVDDSFKTSCTGVYAIGDVAAPLFSSYTTDQLKHANNARLAGSYLVKHLLCVNENENRKLKPFEYHPSVNSHILDINWSFFGDNTGAVVKIFGNLETILVGLWIGQGRIQGALITNGNQEQHDILLKVTKEQKRVLLTSLKDVTEVQDVLKILSQEQKEQKQQQEQQQEQSEQVVQVEQPVQVESQTH
eukprot:c21969_g3_i2.p1 GENE.c21969_g3_i2~~c21969_g3_i2.p1  ORF type:complete len:758 (+),score=277.64 c21969_g3_i2:552-2825(+)